MFATLDTLRAPGRSIRSAANATQVITKMLWEIKLARNAQETRCHCLAALTRPTALASEDFPDRTGGLAYSVLRAVSNLYLVLSAARYVTQESIRTLPGRWTSCNACSAQTIRIRGRAVDLLAIAPATQAFQGVGGCALLVRLGPTNPHAVQPRARGAEAVLFLLPPPPLLQRFAAIVRQIHSRHLAVEPFEIVCAISDTPGRVEVAQLATAASISRLMDQTNVHCVALPNS